MSILIGMLVDLLAAFIVDLLKQFFNLKMQVNAENVSTFRQYFLDQVYWRFWLGMDRMEKANRAYDMVIDNLKKPEYTTLFANSMVTREQFADLACTGIRAKLSA